jgi:DNA ligase-1
MNQNKKTTFPTLYHKTSKGAINVWSVWAEGNSIYTEWGQKDGKMQTSCKEVEQKNIGKINETSLEQQAILEAKSLWTHKLERKYVESLEETQETIFLPMLALKFEDRVKFLPKENIDCYVQRKLNGLRVIAHWKNNQINLMSRGGKSYILPHIQNELSKILSKDMFLDGELYIHGYSLQEINKLARPTKNFNPNSVKLEYHVYDCGVIKNASKSPWSDRRELLKSFFDKVISEKIKYVEDVKIKHLEDIKNLEKQFVHEGYEGAIARLASGCYKFGYRSADLLKVKSFVDDEFKIVDFTYGEGKFKECIIYVCETVQGKRFNVVPKGSFEDRKQWLSEGKSHIGKMLTVKFFDWTEDFIPQFPVGIAIRLEEDLPL